MVTVRKTKGTACLFLYKMIVWKLKQRESKQEEYRRHETQRRKKHE